MTFERLEELAKENALECKHIGHRIHMSAELATRLMQRYQPELADEDLTRLRNAVFGAPLLHELMGIPIINDVGMQGSPTEWILVDPTGEEVERGNVQPEHDEQQCRGHGYKDCRCDCPTCMTHTRKITPHAHAPESSTERQVSGSEAE